MKLAEAMKEKMLLSFELFPPKTEKGMELLSTCANINRNIFPVPMAPAAEMWEQTGKYAR